MSLLRRFLVSTGFKSRNSRWQSVTTWLQNIVNDPKNFAKARTQFLTRMSQVKSIEDIIRLALKFNGPGFYRIAMMQDEYEITTLARRLLDLQPQVIVEIGTANGGTLLVWSQCSSRLEILASIDLPAGRHGGGYMIQKRKFLKLFNLNHPNCKIELLQSDSHNPATKASLGRLLNGRPVDYLFIDGDHRYESVQNDFTQYSSLVRPGGLIAFHDICRDPVNSDVHVDKLWAELKQDPQYVSEEIIHDLHQGQFGIGLLTKRQ